MIVTRKVVRQKMLQTAILAKIDREGLRIDTEEERQQFLGTFWAHWSAR